MTEEELKYPPSSSYFVTNFMLAAFSTLFALPATESRTLHAAVCPDLLAGSERACFVSKNRLPTKLVPKRAVQSVSPYLHCRLARAILQSKGPVT